MDEGDGGRDSARHKTLDGSIAAPTVDWVWLFRLLKISLVAVVLTLLATAAREPGGVELPLSGVIERLVERAVSNVTDELP